MGAFVQQVNFKPGPLYLEGVDPNQPYIIDNLDLNNNIYFDTDNGVRFDQSAAFIEPLGNLTVADSTEPMYVRTGGANLTALARVVPKGMQSAPSPAQIAAQIAISGVPLLSKSTAVVLPTSTWALAAGASTILDTGISINQPGYEIQVQCSSSATSGFPITAINLQWSDSVSGNVVAEETWNLAGASTPTLQTYMGTGPTKGDTLQITVTNGDTSLGSNSGSISMALNSRIYARDDWRQQTFNPVPNQSNPNSDAFSNILCQTDPSVAGNSVTSRILSLYAGKVHIYGACSQAFQISIQTMDAKIGPTLWTIYDSGPRTVPFGDTFDMPRSNCIINLLNNAAGAANVQCQLVISEQLT